MPDTVRFPFYLMKSLFHVFRRYHQYQIDINILPQRMTYHLLEKTPALPWRDISGALNLSYHEHETRCVTNNWWLLMIMIMIIMVTLMTIVLMRNWISLLCFLSCDIDKMMVMTWWCWWCRLMIMMTLSTKLLVTFALYFRRLLSMIDSIFIKTPPQNRPPLPPTFHPTHDTKGL